MKQFSPRIFFEKKEDCIIFYDDDEKKIGKINFNIDKDNLKLNYSNIEIVEKFDNIDYFEEIFEYIIRGAVILPVEQLNIDYFPLEKKNVLKVFKIFEEAFEKFIELQPIKINADDLVIDIIINFKIPKSTHYVQQAYLRNFSSNKAIWESSGKTNKARIFCFDKKKSELVNIGNTESERKFGQKIVNIAKSNYFYSLHFEEFMRHTLESKIAPIFQMIIESRSLRNLTNKDKVVIIQYIILAWNRTFETREYLQESLKKHIKTLATFLSEDVTANEVIVDVDDIWLRIQHESLILRLLDPTESDLILTLLNYEWALIKVRYIKFFLTSDHPVILNNSYFEKEMKNKGKNFKVQQEQAEKNYIKSTGGSGYIKSTFSSRGRALKVKGVEIYLPISPNLCLYLINQQNGIKPLKMQQINKEIILQSNQYVFSKYDRLDFVKKILKKHPESIDKTDKRTSIKGVKFETK